MNNFPRKIFESVVVAVLVGLLSYFSLQTVPNTGDFKTIKVYLAEQPTIDQPWSIYYHGRTGYTALETQEAIGNGTVFSFPIKTTNTFSKIRLDPGKKKIAQDFRLVKIDLTVNEKVVNTFAAAALQALSQPLNHIASMDYNQGDQGIQIKTTKRGDPQLEIKIADTDFTDQHSNTSTRKLVLSILLACLIFAYLSFFEKIKTTFYTLYERLNFSTPIGRIIVFGIAFTVLFSVLWNREKLVPLKFLSIELSKASAIPQDQWKVYLDAGGYQEALSQTGKNVGRTIVFPMTSKLDFAKIRIDPGQSEQEISIKRIQLKSGLETVYSIEDEAVFNQLNPLNQIENVGYDATQRSVSFQTKSGDPFFEIPISNQNFQDKSSLFELLTALLLSLVTALLVTSRKKIVEQLKTERKWIKWGYVINILIFLIQLWLLEDLNYILLVLNVLGLFVLPGLAIRKISGLEPNNALFTGLLGLAFGMGVVLIPLYLTYSLNILNGHYLSLGLSIVLGLFYLWKVLSSPKKAIIDQQLAKTNLGYFTFFNGLFCLFVLPIAGLLCPPLHDPAVIATVAHELSEVGFVKSAIHKDLWNYPPYLQILVAFLAKFSFLSTPKTILLLTNLMVIGSGFAFGVCWQQFFKHRYSFYVSVLLFLFIAPTVPSLYFTAGKNAMIFSIFYWFLLLALLPKLMDRATKLSFRQGVSFAILVIAAFLFHYTVIFIFPILVLFLGYKFMGDLSAQYKLFVKQSGGMLGGILLVGLLFGVFGIYQLQQATYNKDRSLFYAKITEVEESQKRAKLENKVLPKAVKDKPAVKETRPLEQKSKETPVIPKEKKIAPKTINPKPKELNTKKQGEQQSNKKDNAQKDAPKRQNQIFLPTLSFLNNAFSELLYINSKDYSLFKIPLLSNWVGLVLLVLLIFTKRKKEIVLVLLFALTIIVLNNSNIYNLVHYTKVLFFMVPLLVAGYLLNLFLELIQKDKQYVKLFLIGLVLISMQQAIFLSGKYYEYKYYSALTKSDLRAFDFIDENLDKDKFFSPLNVANISDFVSAQGDAALYLHLTDMESIFSYVPSKKIYFDNSTLLRLPYLMNYWRRDLKNSEENLLNRIKQLNVKYLYSGAFAPWGRQIPIERLKNSPNFSLIYDKEGVQIFEIK